jgi:hypothetical protein
VDDFHSNAQPELIPDPLHQLIIGTSVKLMDLGSGVVSCGILTTITLVHAWNSIWYVIASVMPTSVAQPLVEKFNLELNKKKAASPKHQA